jgi:DNA polymerase III delta prime subunit
MFLQAALRRTMEKYTSACRFILVCNNACKVIEPVRSRCVCIRVAAPTKDEIKECLAHVAKKEGLVLPVPLADRIATASNRNLRRAILMLETCKVKQNPLSDTQVIEIQSFRFATLLHAQLSRQFLIISDFYLTNTCDRRLNLQTGRGTSQSSPVTSWRSNPLKGSWSSAASSTSCSRAASPRIFSSRCRVFFKLIHDNN